MFNQCPQFMSYKQAITIWPCGAMDNASVYGTEDCSTFVKERINLEEDLLKFLNKSLIRVNSYISSNNAFVESWRLTKGTLELWCEIQGSCIKNLVDLSKDLIKYHDDLVKSRKRVKEQDVVDAVNLMQTTTTCLQKAKETYSQRCQELLTLKNENAPAKDVAKMKSKVAKAFEEYKSYVEKYAVIRENFEQKMLKSTKAFQAHDTAHLQQMKNFFIHLARSMDDAHSAVSQVTTDYRQSIERMDIDDIMMKFVEEKGTGRDRPEPIKWTDNDEMLDIDIISHITGSHSAASSSNSSAIIHNSIENSVPTVNDLLTLDGPWTMPSTAEAKSADDEDTGSENGVETPKNGGAYSYVPKFTSSLGSQKFSQWLPSRRKKYNSQSSLQVGSSDHISEMTTSQNEKSEPSSGTARGFLKRYKKAKNSMSDLTVMNENKDIFQVDDNRSTASSSKSEDKAAHQPVDNAMTPLAAQSLTNTFSVHDLPYAPPPPPLPTTEPPILDDFQQEKPNSSAIAWPENGTDDFFLGANKTSRSDKNRWSTCTSSSDEGDAEILQATKIRSLQIKPLNESKPNINASMDELRSAVGTLALTKSSTFEKDPWSANSSDFTQNTNVKPLRAAFTGDEHLRKKFTDFDSATLPPGLLFSQSTGPMAGSSIARARPRSHTPTFSSSQYAEMPLDGFATMPRQAPEPPKTTEKQGFASFDKFETAFTTPMSSIPAKSSSPSPSTKSKFPIAMAIQEFVHVWFKSPDLTNPEIKIFGAVLVSFPSSLVAQLTDLKADLSPLKFSLQNADQIKSVMPNKKLILPTPLPSCPSSTLKFTVDRLGLANWLLDQQKTNPSTFYNTEIIRYELSENFPPPLYLQSYWKLDPTQTDIRIDYRLNTEENGVKNALLNMVFSTEISGNAQLFNSAPQAKWSEENKTLSWTLTELSRHGEHSGSLKARLKLSSGPSTPTNTMVQFQCVDSSLSKLSVVLDEEAPYSMSMIKRKIISGKYFCEPEVRH
uniref:MHD domain-containing protein n=1 Tax=Acrobeloides nanus TaxID=290746 RepID=A0A914DI32_9BILA